jgi:L-histidine Nalpha-methyltransferase
MNTFEADEPTPPSQKRSGESNDSSPANLDRDSVTLSDQGPAHDEFLRAVVAGLSASPKTLPTSFLYDQQGSRLFDEICQQPEYYLTRCEQEIMDRHAGDMAQVIGPDALVVEYGSGASQKTRALLAELELPAAYVPLDISTEFLVEVAERINQTFPHLEVLPLAADFNKPFLLPSPTRKAKRTIVYFPGSTIGNFTFEQARAMLQGIAELIGRDGALLIGIDLRKAPEILNAAYDDAAGVTRRFILNILARMQRELHADLDLKAFRYRNFWNDEKSRMEMTLVSESDQIIRVNGEQFAIAAEEIITVEYSYKYDESRFSEMAREAGLMLQRRWTDREDFFSVAYLEPIHEQVS